MASKNEKLRQSQYSKEYYLRNKERISSRQKEYYLRNKEVITARIRSQYIYHPRPKLSDAELRERRLLRKRIYQKKYNAEHVELRRVHRSKRRSLERGAVGSFSHEEWLQLKVMFNFTCFKCYQTEPNIQLTIDHKIPLSRGGTNNLDNIQPLCFRCNSEKRTEI